MKSPFRTASDVYKRQVQGGPAGAATEAAVQYCKEILVVAIAVLLLPVLVLLILHTPAFVLNGRRFFYAGCGVDLSLIHI